MNRYRWRIRATSALLMSEQSGTLDGGDLTLSPSVNCVQPTGAGRERHGPDFHGWVRDGKWVTA